MDHLALALIHNPAPELAAYFGRQRWRFAKTLPKEPHEYLVRPPADKSPDAFAEFGSAVEQLRGLGTPRKGPKGTTIYFAQGGYQYWTGNSAPEKTYVINRCPIFDAYDVIAPFYTEARNGPAFREEEAELRDMLLNWAVPGSVLDIGCGDGMLNRLLLIDPLYYQGIDPSPAMVKIARERFPLHAFGVVSLEASFANEHRRYDQAVSLFGPMSYVMDDLIKKPASLAPRLFLMFYRPGYVPPWYEPAGARLFPRQRSAADLRSIYSVTPLEWRDYLIIRK